MNRKGADAIAAALGIPFDTLFRADMFARSRSSHAKPTPKQSEKSRQSAPPPLPSGGRRHDLAGGINQTWGP